MKEYQVRIVTEVSDHNEKTTETVSTILLVSFNSEDLAKDFVCYMIDAVNNY